MKYENFDKCNYIYEKISEIKNLITHLENEIQYNSQMIIMIIDGNQIVLDKKNYEKIIEVLVGQEEEYLKKLESL